MTETIYTIGHSTHSIEKFIGLLKGQSISAVGDVRSRPYSRMNPQFNREELSESLCAEGMRYVFLGRELGARPDDPKCYRNGQVQFDLLAGTETFRRGIERVKEGAHAFRIALLCAEKEPLDCHRTILVARALVEQKWNVLHILEDGTIDDHELALERLVEKLRIPGEDMFRQRRDVLSDAYGRQGKTIAYREETSDVSIASQASGSVAVPH